MKNGSDDKLHRIFSEVLGVSIDEISEESDPDTLPNWDSIAHLNLVLAIEGEFGITLSPEDAMEMLSVKIARLILEDKGISPYKDHDAK